MLRKCQPISGRVIVFGDLANPCSDHLSSLITLNHTRELLLACTIAKVGVKTHTDIADQ